LGLLAHDMRNPLSALQSNVSFLATVADPESDDMRDAVADTLASCDGLSHIIDNFEVMAHMLAGSPELDRGPVGIVPLVNDVVGRSRAVAKSHGVDVKFTQPSDVAVRVVAHREMLGRALQNVLRNAIQHSPEGASVAVTVTVADGDCVITMADAGPALDKSFREIAFSADGQLTAKGQTGARYGRGLGLYCAAAAAEAAGARIELRDHSGAGNAFSIAVPAHR
jgi:signal transduction histidine kinase